MTRLFPATADFTGGLYKPARFEGEIYDLEVDGTVPDEIDGTFFQVAPDPQYPPMLGDDIFFNGDGAITAFTFKNGHVDFKRRYVMTERLKAQRAARASLHGIYRNRYTNDPSVRELNNSTANTNVVVHGGKLLALKEDSAPYALDPVTMETIGLWDFNGQLTSATFTAHPKIDPANGDLLCFGYEARGDATPDIVYYEIDSSGRKKRETWIVAPYAAMIHDFAVTENYVIFPLMPLTSDLDRMKNGGRHFEWQPGLDQLFGVLRRDGDGRDVRWFKAPNGFQGHTLNAFDDRGRIFIDMPITSGNIFYFFPQADGTVPPPETLASNMMRLTIDMNSTANGLDMAPLTRFPCEFPRSDDRYMGRHYSHGFVIAMDPSKPFNEAQIGPRPFQFFNQLAHINVSTGRIKTWFADDQSCFQEPIFVPKSADAAEGEGYVIALRNRLLEQATDLLILDAQHLDEGPIATVKLPIRLRMSLHGNWVPSLAVRAG
ncbi:carotenoid cleavage dioxygenase-like enzyme [Rhizobium sp. SG_E_25_P2]|uniref:carotenoid oxygenase family protein n=1 Tax=Rhizobium sp. SG_E_25_P2 TaxID=2879942 RepID=UPI002474AB4B|nr:carotenoid oxygenase family protein [Rhizobium sp. SG_E_25_P2]MDH6268200.1 carotenoid cleavage dioxygenase-like enzyme [Rhizobium sp. SG_E_25_P2]